MKTHDLFILLIAITVFMFSACFKGEKQNSGNGEAVNVSTQGQTSVQDDVSAKNVLQVAIESPDHSTLVAAIQAASLENVLSNNGPFTIFAPINSAFEALRQFQEVFLYCLPQNCH